MDRRLALTQAVAMALAIASAMGTPRRAAPAEGRRVPRVGHLSEGPRGDGVLFRAAMRVRGHPELQYEPRGAAGQLERLAPLAAELVAADVDVIWTTGTGATQAAMQATSTIPIVMVSADAVRAGLVASLSHPGGNVTGVTLIGTELIRKRLELVAQLVPGARRSVAVIPGYRDAPFVASWLEESRAAARTLRLGFDVAELAPDTAGWGAVLERLARQPGTTLSVIEYPYFIQRAELLAELMVRHRLPAVFAFAQHVQAGGLVAYGVISAHVVALVADYVSRILRGAKPAALPVQQPTRYALTLNLRTAKALGLTVPQALLLRADETVT